uniref:Palmitoyltransferase n=1 Tax=Laticauda laticaudata TaxID=8630 RepID=A0A8C5S3H7_LATLA
MGLREHPSLVKMAYCVVQICNVPSAYLPPKHVWRPGVPSLVRGSPLSLQSGEKKCISFSPCCRNSFFVVLHLILEGLVYGEYTWEVFSYCQELQFSRLILFLPYLLLAVNAAFFILCSRSNPGIITKSNQLLFLHAYAYDGLMFQQDAECPTCAVRKPARSRHCGVCHACVHRFDHHCVWVNNCIGAFNIRFFLCYLLTLTSMAASVAVVTASFLIQVVLLSNLTLGHYIDDQGQEHPVDTFFLIQGYRAGFQKPVWVLSRLKSCLCLGVYMKILIGY